MTKVSDDILKLMLDSKKKKLQHLHEQYAISVAVYETKREMLIADIDLLEK